MLKVGSDHWTRMRFLNFKLFQIFKRNLEKDIKSETRGDFEKLLVAFSLNFASFLATFIRIIEGDNFLEFSI